MAPEKFSTIHTKSFATTGNKLIQKTKLKKKSTRINSFWPLQTVFLTSKTGIISKKNSNKILSNLCIIAEYDQRKATSIIRLITIIYMEICCMLFMQLILSGI